MAEKFTIEAINRRGPPKSPPHPGYPNGVHVDVGRRPSCRVELTYPAPERLLWAVACQQCGATIMVSAAGRADDPRSVEMPCKAITRLAAEGTR